MNGLSAGTKNKVTVVGKSPISRIEPYYCLISTSYLEGLLDIFILPHAYLTELCVFWFFISLAFNPGHI